MEKLINSLNSLTTAQRTEAMQDLQPLMSGMMDQVTTGALNNVNRVIRTRQEGSRGLSSGDNFVTNSNGWVKVLGSTAKQDNKDVVVGYKANTTGVVLGADGEISSASRIGAAFAYTTTKVDSNSGNQDAKMNSYQLAGYGTYKLGTSTDLDWQADYATNSNTGNRRINFLNQSGSASYDSSSIHLGAGVGRSIAMGATTLIPSVRADYTSLSENAYTDSLGNAVSARDTNQLLIGVDGKVSYAMSDTTKLIANVGVDYNTNAKISSLNTTYAGGGATFAAQGVEPSSATMLAGVGVVVNTSKAMEVTARLDVASRSGYSASTASLKLKMPF